MALFLHELTWEQNHSCHVHYMQLYYFDSLKIHSTRVSIPCTKRWGSIRMWVCCSQYWKMKNLRKAREAWCTAVCCSAWVHHGAYRFCTRWVWTSWAQQKEPPLQPSLEEAGVPWTSYRKCSPGSSGTKRGRVIARWKGKNNIDDMKTTAALFCAPFLHLLNEDDNSLEGCEGKSFSD